MQEPPDTPQPPRPKRSERDPSAPAHLWLVRSVSWLPRAFELRATGNTDGPGQTFRVITPDPEEIVPSVDGRWDDSEGCCGVLILADNEPSICNAILQAAAGWEDLVRDYPGLKIYAAKPEGR